MSLTPEERAALERMKKDVRKPGLPPAAPGQVRPERFSGDPIGMDDSGTLFPVPDAAPAPAQPAAQPTESKKKQKKKKA